MRGPHHPSSSPGHSLLQKRPSAAPRLYADGRERSYHTTPLPRSERINKEHGLGFSPAGSPSQSLPTQPPLPGLLWWDSRSRPWVQRGSGRSCRRPTSGSALLPSLPCQPRHSVRPPLSRFSTYPRKKKEEEEKKKRLAFYCQVSFVPS